VNDINSVARRPELETENIDDLIAGLKKRKPVIAGVTLLTILVMGGLSIWLTPIYRGTAILAAAHSEKGGLGSGLDSALGGSVGGFAALAGFGLSDDSATDEALAVLKSQQLTQEFIEQNHLMPDLFPGSWDVRTGTWKPGLKKVPTIARGYRVFDKIRKIERDNKTGLITLSIDWKDRFKAAQWVNGLVELLNDEMRHRAVVAADASVGYLQKEYATGPDVSTHEAISRLMENEIKQQMLAHVTQEYALRVINKAIPPDADNPVRPNKILFVALGAVFGLLLGAAVAAYLHSREMTQRRRRGP
jgi:uncharacterized protein involved in exopolysaccharide biosynthesis